MVSLYILKDYRLNNHILLFALKQELINRDNMHYRQIAERAQFINHCVDLCHVLKTRFLIAIKSLGLKKMFALS